MIFDPVVVEHYRKLARQCGVWPIARHMAKKGYAVHFVMAVLLRRGA